MLFGAAAVIPANADGEETVPDKVLDCGDYEVEVDGVIDDVYHQSYSIKHEWADSHWCGGKYDADYLSDAGYEAYYKPNGLEFEYTPYDYENGIILPVVEELQLSLRCCRGYRPFDRRAG